MDNSPYLTILNDGIHNFLLHSSEETLELQDRTSIKDQNIFTEIEDVAKEWSVELPVLMEDQDIEESPMEFSSTNNVVQSTMELASDLSNVYEETLTDPHSMVLENGTSEENQDKTEMIYPIEVPGKGFITAEGYFISNDVLLQLNFGSNGELSETNENYSQSDHSHVVQTNAPRPINNNKSLLISKQIPQEKETTINTILNHNAVSRNVELEYSNSLDNVTAKGSNDMYKNLYEVVSAFKCKHCEFLTDLQTIIIEHCKIQHSSELIPKNGQLKSKGGLNVKSITRNGKTQMIYICSVCNLGYGSVEKLKLHMILTHKLAYIPEELEDKNIVNNEANGLGDPKSPIKPEDKRKMQLSLLRQQSKAAKKIKCSVTACELRFALDNMRTRHEKCHVEGQKQFKCFECGLKFSMWRKCSLHLWRCHNLDLGLFTCPMCNTFKASSTVRLLAHMAIHEGEKPYKCIDCEKSFKQHTQLINHQITHRNILPEWASQQQCDVCKKYFSNSKSLKKHIQSVHDKFKPFICSICGHKTARRSMLDLHLRQHTGEKPHQCSICEYKTGDHNSLRRHLMRHSGHTKYSCPHCPYQSIQSTAYKNHIATKHPGQGGSYFCKLCSYHTVNENAYVAHLGDHQQGFIKETPDKVGSGGKNYKNSTSSVRDKKISNRQQSQTQQITRDTEDDESHNYLSMLEHSNDAVDTGGITIPAGFEIPE